MYYYVQANGSFDISGFNLPSGSGALIGIGASINFTDLSSNAVILPFVRFDFLRTSGSGTVNWLISGYYRPPSTQDLQLRVEIRSHPRSPDQITMKVNNLNSQIVNYTVP